ncbi:TPA: hypothetical protein PXM37_004354 [Yersinia enterocolitica]|nr:hypothetical protein [Yersinia enterocolitica]HDL6985372.1 hypothetical protein [Yersinia enterocolitica]HDL7067913.1 hypothetical protein [Yersinia enterocolitica]HDL7072305.1 hypothetical protein [Yersinia enterocolitica]
MDNHSSSGFLSNLYWASEANGVGGHYNVHLYNGDVGSVGDSNGNYVVCRQGL